MDWLMRPCVKGMCKFESLKNGKIDLADIALMNDALDVIADNEYLIQQERERQSKK
ncbi:hypothetical protein SKM58_07785 [Acinetobacter faecalis]|nr:hypothetical protein [Acinetobacter faecalis]MDY6450712.1 hypothetical protein [Acinetobacter faecalis]